MTRGHYSHLDNYEKGNTVPLYEVRNNTWIIWAGCRIFFEKIDGMYSIFFFGTIAAWMYFTTPRFREVVFGYLILLGVIAFIYGLISGQAPNSHYGPYY